MTDPGLYFSAEEIERARSYHGPIYRSWAGSALLGLAGMAVLAFTSAGDRLAVPVESLPRPAFAFLFTGLVIATLAVLRLPVSVWRYLHERRWGFSTQTGRGWLWDWVKARAISIALASVVVTGLVGLAGAVPRSWPVLAALGAGLLAAALSYLGPVVFEPMFNRFRLLDDEVLDGAVRELAGRAGVPVRDVLVADASRRTRKENAYVSGLSRTRRVVVYDTLLERDPAEVPLVVAHELGHWRARHGAKGTALGALGAAAGVGVLWLLLRSDAILAALSAGGPWDPRIAPFVLLVVGALQLLGLPFGTAVSRRWEGEADRASVELTGDAEGFARMARGLALSNLADLAPPRALYLLLFSHPLPQERIAAALATAQTDR